MNAHRTLTIAALILATSAGSAFAAAAPAAPAAAAAAAAAPPPPPTGAPIAGVCVFSYDRAIADSAVGKAFVARLQQLGSQVDAELAPQRTALQTEAQTLETQRATIAPAAFEAQANGLNAKIQTYSQTEQLRARELDQTRTVQLQRIVAQMNPLVVTVYNARSCAAVLDAGSIIAVNPAMDITDDVVRQLNGRMSTITFDRERINPNAPPPAG
jgi:Skp family chaperone for outer membrane proteins